MEEEKKLKTTKEEKLEDRPLLDVKPVVKKSAIISCSSFKSRMLLARLISAVGR